MKMKTFVHTNELISRFSKLAYLKEKIENAVSEIVDMQLSGGKLLLAGCGGSASDSEHISGEFLKGFLLKRPALGEELALLEVAVGEDAAHKLQRGVRAIPLVSLTAVSTAFANDVDPELVFAQSVYALGQRGDIFMGLSTSGNSKSVVKAACVAKALGMKTIALTGIGGGMLADICDICIDAPIKETFRVQEYHLPIYHAICADVENILFGDSNL